VTAGTEPIETLDSDAAIEEWAIGFDGLRVCDASVMPDLPRANTHLTTVAIAERLATLMRVTT
jgi:5-(hydroxymethyl)furfural/furfural oxidase